MAKASLTQWWGAIGVLVLGAARVGAQCTPDWIGGEAFPGANGVVGASVVWDLDGSGPLPPVLVVGGDFTVIGLSVAPRIAAWDGAAWSAPFGAGLSGPVRALTVYNGDLIAAGEFTQAGGSPASRIARWDGSAWGALGLGVDGPVYALAVSNGRLYAGGTFGQAGGAPAGGVAGWDGAAWSAPGTMGVNGAVSALLDFNNELYAGGQFTYADTVPAAGIARWNGSAWAAVGSGVAPADVSTLLAIGGQLFVGGGFVTAGGVTSYGVARWNGTAWSAAGQGLYHRTCIRYSCTNHGYRVRALGPFGNLIYAATDPGAGGTPLIFKFDGTSWTAGGTLSAQASEPWPVTTIASYNGALYLGGSFGGTNAPRNLAVLSNNQWASLGGMDGAIQALTAYNNQLVAAGNFTRIDGAPLNHVASWDGAAWHALGGGISANANTATTLNGTLYVSAWPGGVLQWNGVSWVTLYGAGAFGGPPVVTTWNNQLIAATSTGAFVVPEGDASSVASWNGSAWVPLGEFSGLASGPHPLAVVGSTLYAAGYLGPTSSVGRYTGGEWGSVNTAALGSVSTLLTHNGALHAAALTDVGMGVVGRLSGTTWQLLGGGGGGFDAVPGSLASVNGSLYAIGDFTTVDGAVCNGIARWDGAQWQPLGPGVSGGAVLALAGFGGSVVAGGTFATAGGHGFSSFAVYGCPSPPPCRADVNGDGAVTPADVAAFVNTWFTGLIQGTLDGDFDGNGIVQPADIAAFVSTWFSALTNGC